LTGRQEGSADAQKVDFLPSTQKRRPVPEVQTGQVLFESGSRAIQLNPKAHSPAIFSSYKNSRGSSGLQYVDAVCCCSRTINALPEKYFRSGRQEALQKQHSKALQHPTLVERYPGLHAFQLREGGIRCEFERRNISPRKCVEAKVRNVTVQ
jgi:hypothetical protein